VLDRKLPTGSSGESRDAIASMRIASLPIMPGIPSSSGHQSSSKATMIPINNMYPTSAVRLVSHAELENNSQDYSGTPEGSMAKF